MDRPSQSRHPAAPRGLRVSKQDSHFFNIFSLVIGLLVATALVLFAIARTVHDNTQRVHVVEDPQYLSGVEERIAPPVRVAVAGQDNSALAIVEADAAAGGGGTGLPIPQSPEEVYEVACAACHGQGIAGAPKAGDKAAWAPRIAQGMDTLYQHAIQGYQGEAGVMPAKGGRTDLPDELVRAGVDYMVELSR